MSDRDALAVEYASRNALLNGIDDALAYPSLGFDDIQDWDFDLVVANIPGKAGEQVIASWLRDAPLYLREDGQVGVVVVSPLEGFVSEVVEGLPGAEVVVRERRARHTVFLYRTGRAEEEAAAPVGSFGRGDYDRVQTAFSHGHIDYQMNTVFGLPEFDSLSYRTQLLGAVLQGLDLQAGCRALVLNPGQGHVPVILSNALTPASIDMLDRDLLALRCSARNLVLNGYDASRHSISHRVGLGDDEATWNLVVADMRDEEGLDVMAMHVRQVADHLEPGGRMVIAANSATITRLADVCKKESLGKVQQRKRRRGSSVLVLAR